MQKLEDPKVSREGTEKGFTEGLSRDSVHIYIWSAPPPERIYIYISIIYVIYIIVYYVLCTMYYVLYLYLRCVLYHIYIIMYSIYYLYIIYIYIYIRITCFFQ